ncbi:phosphoserine phosphatase [Aspergillus steynii IBT 23096]|uniref:Phosphoserine phosphatase n=1 Tax=Aspergillus steynii IBT 23096 TaxID=1392250 RepID=A0A2I2G0F6_9EURO|nr:phosphoserine phosphatase [Aspergillus steynii IBT 23096]PLB46364.1 phosphoserine phosphatase [Aspergillus steynii IBT 23096]
MGSQCVELPYIAGDPNIIFFTDFDGTITLEDSNDHLVDNLGFGIEKRRALELDVLKGKLAFRDAFKVMLDSVPLPFDECVRILQRNIKFDPYFVEFYHWASDNNVPIVVLSSGMTPIIKALLQNALGDESGNIFVIANDVEAREGKLIDEAGGWQIKYRDESQYGHDKSRAITPYASLPEGIRPILMFAGDGVSDLSAASGSHILFAKQGLDLARYCAERKMPFVPFNNWASIRAAVQDINEGGLRNDRLKN